MTSLQSMRQSSQLSGSALYVIFEKPRDDVADVCLRERSLAVTLRREISLSDTRRASSLAAALPPDKGSSIGFHRLSWRTALSRL